VTGAEQAGEDGRILRQVLTESAVLGGLGALMGLGLASMLLGRLLATARSDVPRLDEVRMDGPVLLFALALAGVCSILFGLAQLEHHLIGT
jgi:putative ABC transport system permease protein